MEIIEINTNEWTERQGLSSTGKRVKAWYVRNHDNKVFLFKVPKKYESINFITFELWTEIIAYQVGTALGLDMPFIYPAKNQDEYGVLVENFIAPDESLTEAKDFLRPFGQNPHHNINLIENFLKNFNAKLWHQFKKMLIFDALIGNNDRHDENWGLCYKIDSLINQNKTNVGELRTTLRFAPIYDNASCLTRELTEEGVKDILDDDRKFNKYVNGKKSKPPNLYWDEKDPKLYKHFDLMAKLIEKEPDTRQVIQDFLQVDYICPVSDMIKKIQCIDLPEEHKLSDNRVQAIIKILESRKTTMQELL